jgi:hypothetical protein
MSILSRNDRGQDKDSSETEDGGGGVAQPNPLGGGSRWMCDDTYAARLEACLLLFQLLDIWTPHSPS